MLKNFNSRSYLEVVVEHLLAVEEIGARLAEVAQVDL